jgi:hypothetical protein
VWIEYDYFWSLSQTDVKNDTQGNIVRRHGPKDSEAATSTLLLALSFITSIKLSSPAANLENTSSSRSVSYES